MEKLGYYIKKFLKMEVVNLNDMLGSLVNLCFKWEKTINIVILRKMVVIYISTVSSFCI